MVTLFVGGVVLMLDRIIALFLQQEIFGARVFRSRPNPYRGKAVKLCATVQCQAITFTCEIEASRIWWPGGSWCRCLCLLLCLWVWDVVCASVR